MSSDADLSTEDLARPAGARSGDAAGRQEGGRAGGAGTGVDERAPGTGGEPRGGAGMAEDDARTAPESPAVSRDDGAMQGGTTKRDPAMQDTVTMQDAARMQGGTTRAAGTMQDGASVQGGGTTRDADSMQDEGADPRARAPQQGARPGDSTGGGSDVALVGPDEGARFRQRWGDVQARFVDDPRGAVQDADGLVAELMQSLARGFSDHKGRLESAWQSGDDPDTEELRQALQRYRSFFDRLLST